MFEGPVEDGAIYLARVDSRELLSTFSRHSILLDDGEWPSVEHYYQAMKFEDAIYREVIRAADHPRKARRLGRSRLKYIRKDWGQIRRVIMTRGVYTKCHSYPDVAERLLLTGEMRLVESSSYDYYWGCGRDRRGNNHYGRILMNVRNKLREELREAGR